MNDDDVCEICDDGLVFCLGTLGNLTWFKCRNCGMEQLQVQDREE